MFNKSLNILSPMLNILLFMLFRICFKAIKELCMSQTSLLLLKLELILIVREEFKLSFIPVHSNISCMHSQKSHKKAIYVKQVVLFFTVQIISPAV